MTPLRILAGTALLAALLALPGSALAVTISIDADPLTPGIQSSITVDPAQQFSIDVLIQDLGLRESVNGFYFDVRYDSSVLAALDVTTGNYLKAPAIAIYESLGSIGVQYAELSFNPFGGATGDGILASITFEAIGVGVSGLDPVNLIVSQPWRLPLSIDEVNGASISVGLGDVSGGTAASPVPEPSAALLFVVGGLVLRAGRRR